MRRANFENFWRYICFYEDIHACTHGCMFLSRHSFFFSYEFGKGIQFRHTGEKKERRMVEFGTIYGQVSICRTDDGRTDR